MIDIPINSRSVYLRRGLWFVIICIHQRKLIPFNAISNMVLCTSICLKLLANMIPLLVVIVLQTSTPFVCNQFRISHMNHFILHRHQCSLRLFSTQLCTLEVVISVILFCMQAKKTYSDACWSSYFGLGLLCRLKY